jgi:hypothetical protein
MDACVLSKKLNNSETLTALMLSHHDESRLEGSLRFVRIIENDVLKLMPSHWR